MTSQSLLEVTSRHGGVVRVWRATASARGGWRTYPLAMHGQSALPMHFS